MNKKIVGIFGILLILMIATFFTPAIGLGVDQKGFENLESKWEILIVIGRINICFEEKVISGFALIGYTAGETLTFENINIEYEGLPLFVNNGLFFSFCFYKPADTNI